MSMSSPARSRPAATTGVSAERRTHQRRRLSTRSRQPGNGPGNQQQQTAREGRVALERGSKDWLEARRLGRRRDETLDVRWTGEDEADQVVEAAGVDKRLHNAEDAVERGVGRGRRRPVVSLSHEPVGEPEETPRLRPTRVQRNELPYRLRGTVELASIASCMARQECFPEHFVEPGPGGNDRWSSHRRLLVAGPLARNVGIGGIPGRSPFHAAVLEQPEKLRFGRRGIGAELRQQGEERAEERRRPMRQRPRQPPRDLLRQALLVLPDELEELGPGRGGDGGDDVVGLYTADGSKARHQKLRNPIGRCVATKAEARTSNAFRTGGGREDDQDRLHAGGVEPPQLCEAGTDVPRRDAGHAHS